MTPREFALAVEGHAQRIEQEQQLFAWHACTIANVWLPRGKRLKPSDLLASKSAAPVLMDQGALRDYMRERIAKGG